MFVLFNRELHNECLVSVHGERVCMVSMRLHGGEFALSKVGDDWSFTCLRMSLYGKCKMNREFHEEYV